MNSTESNQTPTLVSPCRYCTNPADGPDRFCTPCRAELACSNLCETLTDALEDFLDDRWAPHNLGDYYYDAPIFDGDPQEYLTKIRAAVDQIRDAAEQLVELALGRPARVRSSHPGKYMEEGGFHAYLEWKEDDE